MMDSGHRRSLHWSWWGSCCNPQGWVPRPQTHLVPSCPAQPRGRGEMLKQQVEGEVCSSHMCPRVGSACGWVCCLQAPPKAIQAWTQSWHTTCAGTCWVSIPKHLLGNGPGAGSTKPGDECHLSPNYSSAPCHAGPRALPHSSRLAEFFCFSPLLLFTQLVPTVQPLVSMFLVGCRSLQSVCRIKLFPFLRGPSGKLWSCLHRGLCRLIPEILMSERSSVGLVLLLIISWKHCTGKAQTPLRAKLSLHFAFISENILK